MIIVRSHLDELGYCARGSRRWCASAGINWAEFVRCGIDADVLLATGDAMAIRLVEHVRDAQNGKGVNGQQ